MITRPPIEMQEDEACANHVCQDEARRSIATNLENQSTKQNTLALFTKWNCGGGFLCPTLKSNTTSSTWDGSHVWEGNKNLHQALCIKACCQATSLSQKLGEMPTTAETCFGLVHFVTTVEALWLHEHINGRKKRSMRRRRSNPKFPFYGCNPSIVHEQ